MQVQTALGLVAQRPQPCHLLSVEVELGGVLQAQHHRVLADALLAGLPMRLHHVVPADVFVRQEAVRCHRLAPVLTRIRKTRLGLLGQPLGQQHCPAVEPRIAQIQGPEFFRRPAHTLTPVITKLSSYEMCITGCVQASLRHESV